MDLNQVTLPTLDLARAVTFYQMLGMRLIVHSPPRYARFECPEGNATFSLHLVDSLPQGGGIMVYFECHDLDKQVSSLLAQGVLFEQLPQDQPWLWREARLRDPDQNQLILYYGGKNRKHPPWRLKTN